LALIAAPRFSYADAAADLVAGQAALQELDLEKALPLLSSAAEALPQSVDAQLTLAECQLRRGDLEAALNGYSAVIKLSKDHKLANRMVAALTGQQSSYAKHLAMIKALMNAEDYTSASATAARAIRLPITESERLALQVLQAECTFWTGRTDEAFRQALSIIHSGDAQASLIANTMAAMSIAQTRSNIGNFDAHFKAAEKVAEPWKTRLAFAKALHLTHDSEQAVHASNELARTHASLPVTIYRRNVLQFASYRLQSRAQTLWQKGDYEMAWNILRPMAISQDAQVQANKTKTLADTNTGWAVSSTATVDDRLRAASAFAAFARAEQKQHGVKADLQGYRVAASLLDGSPERNRKLSDQLAVLVKELSTFRTINPERKADELLNPAEAVITEIAGRLIQSAVSTSDRNLVVSIIDQQLARFGQADALEVGLRQFVSIDKNNAAILKAPFASIPQSESRRHLLHGLAEGFAALGIKQIAKAERSVVKVDITLNSFDSIALGIYAQSQLESPNDDVLQSAMAVVSKYSTRANWKSAGAALALLYADQKNSAGQLASVALALEQARYRENQLIAARRSIGKELSAPVKSALVQAVALVNASAGQNAGEADRKAVTQIAEGLINRYAEMGRIDLSQSIIASLADGDAAAKSLGDWATWTRINLLHVQANESLARTAAGLKDRSKVAVDAKHTAELALLSTMIKTNAASIYAPFAVTRVAELASAYQSYRAFPAATTILSDFLKAHPNLSAVQRFEYGLVDLQLADANNDLNESAAKNPKIEKISAKHLVAIKSIAAFLDKYPVGNYSRAAEDELFSVLKRYGQIGAWNVSREVLVEFSKALPDYRSPAHLELLKAATYLGELDIKHGSALLNPNPTVPQGTISSSLSQLAMLDGSDLEDALERRQKIDKIVSTPVNGPINDAPAVVTATPRPAKQPVASKPSQGAPQPGDPAQFGGAAGGFGYRNKFPTRRPTTPAASSLAMIRQSQAQQFQQIAMLESKKDGGKKTQDSAPGEMAVTLPSGTILSLAEMQRQDTASESAYQILITLAKSTELHDQPIATQARAELMWMFGYFEGSLRFDRAIVMLKKYLVDHPKDPDRIALAYRALEDRLAQVSQPPKVQMDQNWVDLRHTQFDEARNEITEFVKAQSTNETWANSARLLRVNSYQTEANLVVGFSGERASGLLVQSAEALLELQGAAPKHPDAAGFPTRLWDISEQLAGRNHSESAISVLRQIAVKYPTNQLGTRAIIRIAQLYGSNLSNPIMAVKTYQEYLNKTTGDASVPTEIYNIANQLAQQQRFLEALHVYGVFVDSFPTDGRAAQALHAIGKTHQANAAWQEAIDSYDRLFEEYPASPVIPQSRVDVAECEINLGNWSTARRLYEEYVEKFPKHGQAKMATDRLDVLKKLDRFQDLLADDAIDRNKDDAQYQIGKTVLTELNNPIKAITEFRKVVKNFPKSDVADDAQLEIGRTLLSLNQMEAGRTELLKIPKVYGGSSLADDALYLVAQSYEQFAVRIASVTLEKAREESHRIEQGQAYARFNKQIEVDTKRESRRRGQLKASGKSQELALNDAAFAWQQGSSQVSNLFCHVTQAELQTETETALQVANRRDQINDAFREAVVMYAKAASDYPLGDMTDQSLLRVADILESKLKDRPAAMQTYQKIVKLFPGTPVAENAAWKVATFHVQEAKYAAAVGAYQSFIRNYPASTRVAEAQFGMAEVLEQLGRWNEAMDAYEVFRQKFTKHPKVTLAAQQITWIKTYRK
jgi:TolA-binding protein/thioredoxin-like negative regulator of GroEL